MNSGISSNRFHQMGVDVKPLNADTTLKKVQDQVSQSPDGLDTLGFVENDQSYVAYGEGLVDRLGQDTIEKGQASGTLSFIEKDIETDFQVSVAQKQELDLKVGDIGLENAQVFELNEGLSFEDLQNKLYGPVIDGMYIKSQRPYDGLDTIGISVNDKKFLVVGQFPHIEQNAELASNGKTLGKIQFVENEDNTFSEGYNKIPALKISDPLTAVQSGIAGLLSLSSGLSATDIEPKPEKVILPLTQ